METIERLSQRDYYILKFANDNKDIMNATTMCKHLHCSSWKLNALCESFGIVIKKGRWQSKMDAIVAKEQDARAEEIAEHRLNEQREHEHEMRLNKLLHKARKARRYLPISHPYKIAPSLSWSEWDECWYNYYKEKYLWQQ